MSNALAIATVTAALQQALQAAVAPVAGATVTFVRPDAPAGLPETGVNVFLYQVTPNVAFRNADLPTRRPDGSALCRPTVALDLHYLLTFYGDDAALVPQRLLGLSALQFHAQPAVLRTAINDAKTAFPAVLGASDLDKAHDLVRVTPNVISLEEMSKVWSVLFQTKYALSVAYVAGPVLIEAADPPAGSALPVLVASVTAVPLAVPVVTGVAADDGSPDPLPDDPTPPAVPFADPLKLVVVGRHLNAAGTAVLFRVPAPAGRGSPTYLAGTVDPTSADERLVVTVPAGLPAGGNSLTVVQPSASVLPPVVPTTPAQGGGASDPAIFLIRPAVEPPPPAAAAGQTIVVAVRPSVSAAQSVTLQLNPTAGGGPAAVLPLKSAVPTAVGGATLTFDASALPTVPTVYLARVVVDTAESPLTGGGSPGHPYTGPTVTYP